MPPGAPRHHPGGTGFGRWYPIVGGRQKFGKHHPRRTTTRPGNLDHHPGMKVTHPGTGPQTKTHRSRETGTSSVDFFRAQRTILKSPQIYSQTLRSAPRVPSAAIQPARGGNVPLHTTRGAARTHGAHGARLREPPRPTRGDPPYRPGMQRYPPGAGHYRLGRFTRNAGDLFFGRRRPIGGDSRELFFVGKTPPGEPRDTPGEEIGEPGQRCTHPSRNAPARGAMRPPGGGTAPTRNRHSAAKTFSFRKRLSPTEWSHPTIELGVEKSFLPFCIQKKCHKKKNYASSVQTCPVMQFQPGDTSGGGETQPGQYASGGRIPPRGQCPPSSAA